MVMEGNRIAMENRYACERDGYPPDVEKRVESEDGSGGMLWYAYTALFNPFLALHPPESGREDGVPDWGSEEEKREDRIGRIVGADVRAEVLTAMQE